MYEYDFHTYSVRRKRSNKKIFFSFFGVVFVITFAFWFIFNQDISGPQKQKKVLSSFDVEEEINANTHLGSVVKQALAKSEGEYSVVVKHLETGESYSLNAHKVYESGSLYKLWVMAEAYRQINENKFQEDTKLTTDVSALNKKFRIASEEAEMTDGEISFTVASALKQMITISHNYAALSLTNKVGLSNVKKFLENNNFTESKVGTNNTAPTTSAYDTASFFEKLLKGELGDSLSTEKMVDLLKSQKLNSKLPKYLPESAIIAHKTGEIGYFTHDAGIVYTQGGKYIIVVLSKSNYPPGAEERIAEISRAVYEYFVH